jgi:hypothetical protein
MKLPELLEGRSADDQGAAARKNVGQASLDELLDALDVEPLGEWALLHITYELTHRGAVIIAPIAARLVARPTRPGHSEPRRTRAVPVLISYSFPTARRWPGGLSRKHIRWRSPTSKEPRARQSLTSSRSEKRHSLSAKLLVDQVKTVHHPVPSHVVPPCSSPFRTLAQH